MTDNKPIVIGADDAGLGLKGKTPRDLIAYGLAFTVVSLAGWFAVRWLAPRADPVLYPIAVLLTIVVTGNHFVLDALIGYAVMATGFALSWALFERNRGKLRTRRGVEQSGSSPGS